MGEQARVERVRVRASVNTRVCRGVCVESVCVCKQDTHGEQACMRTRPNKAHDGNACARINVCGQRRASDERLCIRLLLQCSDATVANAASKTISTSYKIHPAASVSAFQCTLAFEPVIHAPSHVALIIAKTASGRQPLAHCQAKCTPRQRRLRGTVRCPDAAACAPQHALTSRCPFGSGTRTCM